MRTTRARLFPALLLALAALPPAPAADPEPVPGLVRWRTEYVAARREAAERKLPLLIVVSTADCAYCEKLQTGPLADPATRALIADRFLPLKLDGASNPDFVSAMRINTFPTTIVAGSDGKIHGYLAGYLDVAPFRDNVVKALELVPVARPPVVVRAEPVEVKLVASEPSVAERWDAAKVAFAREQYGEALERFETLIRLHPKAEQSKEAAAYVARIKADAERLAAEAAAFDEQTAAAYFALAESWVKQARPKEAATCYAKAIQVAPAGTTAELAQAKLKLLKK